MVEMAKMQSSYTNARERLEEIVTQIKAKDVPLERSLDLYEEALRLGSSCAEMIDRTDFSADELAQVGRDETDADIVDWLDDDVQADDAEQVTAADDAALVTAAAATTATAADGDVLTADKDTTQDATVAKVAATKADEDLVSDNVQEAQ